MASDDLPETIETDVDANDAAPSAAAALLESVAQALRNAPDDTRYDVDLGVREHD